MILFLLINLVSMSPDTSELGAGHQFSKFAIHRLPDPVNIRTLNFFLPLSLLEVPCQMSIEIKSSYNSYSGDSSIFGKKWTFNHNIRVKPAKSKFEVHEGDGFLNIYTREKNLEEAKKALVSQLLIARKKKDLQSGDLKSDTQYAEYEKRLLSDATYREEEGKLISTPRPLGPGEYYSFARGPSKLIMKPDKTFVREFQNGAKEFFNADGRITRSEDRNGNYLNYVYQDENLVRINDMCGRSMTFTYQTDGPKKGLISSIKDGLNRELKFVHDGDRRLLSYSESDGKVTSFRYDKVGNILEMTPKGQAEQKLTFEYNPKFEVTKQIGPGTQTTTYKRTFVANNPNHSITEVTKLDNGKMLSRELHEFKLKEYETATRFNAAGKEIYKESRKFSPETGYPVSILDGRGQGDLFQYDGQTGNLMRRESIPSGEIMEFKYDPRCNQVSTIVLKRPNAQDVTSYYKFDAKCNLQEAKEITNNKTSVDIKLKYNKHGKITFLTDVIKKKEIAFQYWEYGKPESITLKDVGTLLVKYSPPGEILKVDTLIHGEGKKRFKGMEPARYQSMILNEIRSALDTMLNYLRPAGLNIGL